MPQTEWSVGRVKSWPETFKQTVKSWIEMPLRWKSTVEIPICSLCGGKESRDFFPISMNYLLDCREATQNWSIKHKTNIFDVRYTTSSSRVTLRTLSHSPLVICVIFTFITFIPVPSTLSISITPFYRQRWLRIRLARSSFFFVCGGE